MECSYNTRSEEECTLERKAVEERELLRELTMSRMSDKMKLLEQENKEVKCTMREMEDQILRLKSNHDVDVETSIVNHEIVHTQR